MKTMSKMTRIPFFILIFCIGHLHGQQQTTEARTKERSYTYQERELEYLMVIWPGEYDNVEQLDFDKALKKNTIENGGHARTHSFIERVDLPNFGAYVLYVEEYKNDNPSMVVRQCIYVLIADEEAKAIRIKVRHFKNLKPYLSVKKELDFLKTLAVDSSLLRQGCDMLIQRQGMAFKGKTADVACNPHETDAKLTVDYQIRVSENDYWFEEINYDRVTKTRLPDAQQSTPYQLEKTRCFVCMIDYPNDTNGRPTITKYYIKIHDQGGKFEFDYPDGRHMVLGMRNTWSFGMQRETFVIFIQEGSQKGPTLIYSWGNPKADRIGFNPGWIRVQCDLDTPENRKLQHGLRPGS